MRSGTSRDPAPLVSHDHDVTLLKSLRKKRAPSLKQWFRLPGLLTVRERRLFFLAHVVLIAALIWFGSTLVLSNLMAVPAVGGKYVEAVVGAPQYINPLFASTNDTDVDLTRLMYSGLMRHDASQRLIPDLASKYEESEDKLQYTFTLREDVKWHDGEPFTADDVLYTFETIQDPAVNSPLLVSFQGVLVEKIDEYTVRFTLPEAFPSFLASLTVGILPEHIWLGISPDQLRLSQRNIQPIGTGPFQFSKLIKDERGRIVRYEMSRVADWYRQSPYIESFSFAFYSAYAGPGGAIQDLREKKVDGLHYVPYDLRAQVTRKHVELHTLQLPQYTALMFNQQRNDILSEKDVRLALACSIDKDRILRETLDNEGQIIHSPILPGFPGYDPERLRDTCSTSEANELLDDHYDRLDALEYRTAQLEKELAAYKETLTLTTPSSTPEGEDEESRTAEDVIIPADVQDQIEASLDARLDPAQPFYRTDKDGNILKLKLVTSDTSEYTQAIKLVAGMWQELGIVTEVSLVPAKDMSRDVLKGRQYDVLLYGMLVGEDPDQYPFWHSSQVAFPGLNLSQYANKDVDQILEDARETTDIDEQVRFYGEFQDALKEDIPAVFLYMPTYTYATSDDIKGFDVVRISHPSDRFNGVESWYLKTKRTWSR